jgi:hypothetical protein
MTQVSRFYCSCGAILNSREENLVLLCASHAVPAGRWEIGVTQYYTKKTQCVVTTKLHTTGHMTGLGTGVNKI